MGEGDGEFALDVAGEFVVCVNYLASPYGSSSPVTPDPAKGNGESYAADFPTPVTVRDNVRLQRLRRWRRCLGVRRQTREPALGKRKLQPRDLVGRAVVHHRN